MSTKEKKPGTNITKSETNKTSTYERFLRILCPEEFDRIIDKEELDKCKTVEERNAYIKETMDAYRQIEHDFARPVKDRISIVEGSQELKERLKAIRKLLEDQYVNDRVYQYSIIDRSGEIFREGEIIKTGTCKVAMVVYVEYRFKIEFDLIDRDNGEIFHVYYPNIDLKEV